jgi:hypothetical protein
VIALRVEDLDLAAGTAVVRRGSPAAAGWCPSGRTLT